MYKEFNLTKPQVKRILSKYNDLLVQAMIFDMDIDIETCSLTEKSQNEVPIWIKRWREKRNEEDFDERFDIDRE